MKRKTNFFTKACFQLKANEKEILKQLPCLQLIILFFSFSLVSCSYNPFILNNHTTGSPTGAVLGGLAGGVLGSGLAAAFGGSRTTIALGAIGGGALGYYFTTLRYDAGGIILTGGQVYKIGDYVGIYISSDCLFEPNTADFLPYATNILDSAAEVLARYPNNNILISGNTSGFACSKWEQKLSERRAQRIAAYLWNSGISPFRYQSINMRKLNYVGYGDYLPTSHKYTNLSIRQNSRIQITSYPASCDLQISQQSSTFQNVGSSDDNYNSFSN
jgi:flagellar motor protein MotB